jgi:hypothetical protein
MRWLIRPTKYQNVAEHKRQRYAEGKNYVAIRRYWPTALQSFPLFTLTMAERQDPKDVQPLPAPRLEPRVVDEGQNVAPADEVPQAPVGQFGPVLLD